MIDSLMPLFISLAQSKARIAAAAAATHFLADMDMTKNSSKMIKDFLIKILHIGYRQRFNIIFCNIQCDVHFNK